MSDLVELMTRYVEQQKLHNLEGIVDTVIPGIRFFRSTKTQPKKPFIYESGTFILGQGYKKITVGNGKQVTYGPNDYLVAGVPIPLECESFGSEQEPILGLSVHFDHVLLMRQVALLEQHGRAAPSKRKDCCGVKSVAMSDVMVCTCERIMLALLDPTEAHVLAEGLIAELLYRVLTDSEGHLLFDLASYEGNYARVAKSLAKVHRDYSQNLTVLDLAQEANMSVSAFHQAFRDVTMESPLQYVKKVRLNKARELIQVEGMRVNEAARQVGYASASQFNREFKRLFNETPKGQKVELDSTY